MASAETTVTVSNVPEVRAVLEQARAELLRARSAARAALAALLLITGPRASQHVVAARPRVRAGYLLVADELLGAYDFAPLPEAQPGQKAGLAYTVVPSRGDWEDVDSHGPYTTVTGMRGPPGFEAALHDALARAAGKGLTNIGWSVAGSGASASARLHAEMQADPETYGRHLSDAATHAANLVEWVMISVRSDADRRRAFFKSLVDADAARDAAHALGKLDELRNTAIPCACIREEIVRPLPHLDAVSEPPQNRGAR